VSRLKNVEIRRIFRFSTKFRFCCCIISSGDHRLSVGKLENCEIMAWNPALYLKFNAARIRPAIDLLQTSSSMFSNPSSVKNVLDLGCGPGNVTPYLCQSFINAHVEGVDSSEEMIDKANKTNYEEQMKNRISFRVGTIENEGLFNTRSYDLVYSNAALHWCVDHHKLLPRLLNTLVAKNGGVLAIQMPDTMNQPSHTLMETAALRCGLLNSVQNIRIPRTEHSPDWYFKLLSPICKEVEMWSTEYIQQLPIQPQTYKDSHDPIPQRHPVLEFTKSTGLMPIISALGGELNEKCQKYLDEYNRLLEEEYPTISIKNKFHSRGKTVVLMPFKRFFIVCKT
jgi:trans-aconitate 2-methyltransferase